MTLIAFTSTPNEFMFLLGDILLSKDGPTSIDISLVTTLIKSSEIKVGSGSIAGVQRKLCKINDQFLVAWCDSAIKARVLLQELKDHFGDKKNVSKEEVYSFLNQVNQTELLPYPKLGEVSIIVMLNNSEMRSVFRWDSWKGQKKTGDDPKRAIIGSGTDDYINIINDIMNDKKNIQATLETPGLLPANILARLLTTEILANSTLQNGFGGWFEFITPYEQGFKPWTNYTVFLWDLEMCEGKLSMGANPAWIYKPFYINETLGIFKTTLGLFQEEDISVQEGIIHIDAKPELHLLFVDPIIGEGIKKEDIKIPEDFSYECALHIHLFNTTRLPINNNDENQALCIVSDSDSSPVCFNKEPKDFGFTINYQSLLKMVKDVETIIFTD